MYPGYPTRRQNEERFSLFQNQLLMTQTIKQVVGIDVAQQELVCCLGRISIEMHPELYAHKTFANTGKGFEALVQWVNKLADPALGVRYIMEATGVYHESLAYWLFDQGCTLSVVLPNKISNYVRTLDTKTITDKTSSQAIAAFGLQRHLDDWKRPNPLFRKLRQLVRERDQVVQERTSLKNQLHAEMAEALPGKTSLVRMNKRLALLNKQVLQIKEEIQELIKSKEEVSVDVKRICTISGVGVLTAATVLAETNGFELIRNKRQLSSYAGLDVKQKQSGTSVNGKPRISKRGNKYLRKAMYMPALSAIRLEGRFKEIFARHVSKHGIKMKAAVAVQRKLLEMIYTIYKTKQDYDPGYIGKKVESNQKATLYTG
jgi:transposase